MKPEQKVGIIFSFFGIAMGFFSTQFAGSIAWSIPIIIYIALIFGMKKLFKGKKAKWVVTNSILTFLFMWIVSWIFILNAV